MIKWCKNVANLATFSEQSPSFLSISKSDLGIIRDTATEYVREIFRRLREHGYDENTMRLYVTGGGGCLVKNFWNYDPDRVILIDDIRAAAKGYEYIAQLQLEAGVSI